MRRNLAGSFLLVAFGMGGCAPKTAEVWVNLDSIVWAKPAQAVVVPAPKRPTTGSPAETFGLPGRPAQVVAGPTSGAEEETAAAAEASQATALKRLRKRLSAVYSRQADFYAEEQARLLGDPESRALDKLLPDLKRAFQAYAVKRTPLVIKLINLAGFPDVNPKGDPPPATLSPVDKKFWLSANNTRSEIGALDAEYSKTATAILAQVDHLANQDRLALLAKVDAYRRQMNERATLEATNPFENAHRSEALHLAAEPAVVLPPLAVRTMTLPAVPPLPDPPKVDLGEAQPSTSQKRLMLGRQLAIWLALNQRVLAAGPGRGVPDETGNFDHWRQQQQAGP